MSSKGIVKGTQRVILAVGKTAAEEAKAFAAEVADAAAAAATAATAAGGIILNKVAATIEARTALRAKTFADKTATTAAPSTVVDNVATTEEPKRPTSRPNKKIVKRKLTKKRAAPKVKTKKASRTATKKK